MNIREKVKELLKYCADYQGHTNMMDERRKNYDFNVELPEEKGISAHLNELQFILLTGEAGDGKTHLIHALKEKLTKNGFKLCEDFSAESEDDKKQIVQKVEEIVSGKTEDCIIVAANVGIFTKTVLMYEPTLIEELNKENPKIKIINFEKRNIAGDKKVFYQIVQEFLKYDGGNCLEEQCIHREHCIYKKNLDMLLSNQGVESVRVLCDVICLIGEHVTFRDLLSLLSYMVTFGETCEQRTVKSDVENCSYENIFDKMQLNKLFATIGRMDPAFKNTAMNEREYSTIEQCRRAKRQRFFVQEHEKYPLLAIDYLPQFRNVIHLFQKEPFLDVGMVQDGELYLVKKGLGRIIRRGQSDLSIKVADTPTMLGNDIQTEFELGDIDIVWHRYGLDFNHLEENTRKAEEENRFCMSYIYQGEEDQVEAITMVIDYRLFRYLMMAEEYYYLSHNSKSIEEYTINTFFRKIIKKKAGAYEKMIVRFTDQKQRDVCDFSLKMQKKSILESDKRIIKIRREG